MNSLAGAIIFFIVWSLLGVVLFSVLFRLLRVERDTRIQDEVGKTPEFESVGRANINRSSWSLRKMGRLSLYDTFLVASARSRRVILPYERIVALEEDRFRRSPAIRIRGPVDGELHRPDIRFAGPNIDAARRLIESKRSRT